VPASSRQGYCRLPACNRRSDSRSNSPSMPSLQKDGYNLHRQILSEPEIEDLCKEAERVATTAGATCASPPSSPTSPSIPGSKRSSHQAYPRCAASSSTTTPFHPPGRAKLSEDPSPIPSTAPSNSSPQKQIPSSQRELECIHEMLSLWLSDTETNHESHSSSDTLHSADF
jgi:hypothetical protein